MKDELTYKRHLVENEAIFRKLNENITKGIEKTNKLALEHNQPEYVITPALDDVPLQFYCECSDENCTLRVPVNYKDYEKVHSNRDYFIVVPSHQVPSIEKIVRKETDYYVVQKLVTPPEKPSTLHRTPIDNS